eukprot:TRINITY_DN8353_c0_g2_i1.p1 TRINITY_DN8353_c0_g2~~TRINITY_DN8353_c0_g2_i1.p1  ORF type:complete len:516 (+),score=115.73 TRINITY_DN8353_c0_g2_i1:61-1608(+)
MASCPAPPEDIELIDLRHLVKERFFRDVVRASNPDRSYKILVLDKATVQIVSAAVCVSDMVEANVAVVEKLELKRQPIPKLEAIYVITPTLESVRLLCEDFQDAAQPMYAAAHVFFTSNISEDIIKKLKGERAAQHIKTMRDWNLRFVAHESQAFHFDNPQAFHSFFSPNSSDIKAERIKCVDQLVSLCVTLKEYPIVRYRDNGTAKPLAELLQRRLDLLFRSHPDYAYAGTANAANRAHVLILDRSQDLIAPILHEFTYQAMIYDLLPIDHDHYRYEAKLNEGGTKDKEVILGEHDALWSRARRMHVADLMNWLVDDFNDFLSHNRASDFTTLGVMNLKGINEAVRALPQFKNELSKYSLHINISEQLMLKYNVLKLERLATLEQMLSTGEELDGSQPRNVVQQLCTVLADDTVDLLCKVRLLLLYVITHGGLSDDERKKLFEAAKAKPHDTAIVTNLRHLGISVSKPARGRARGPLSPRRTGGTDGPSYDLSRYVPNLRTVTEVNQPRAPLRR